MPLYSAENIPYTEWGVITELLRKHPEIHRDKLRALLVFGSLVSTGGPYNINLLEVVQDWEGPRHVRFTSTSALPLRGRLDLYFLRPEEFENPTSACLPGEHWSSADLLMQVRNAYAIMLENPINYASEMMEQYESSPSVADNETSAENPISFLQRQENIPAMLLLN